MDLILWIVFGALAGWIATMVMGGSEGFIWDIVLGIVGAVLGGYLMNYFGQSGVTGFNLYSMFVAVVGSIILIAIGRMLRRSV